MLNDPVLLNDWHVVAYAPDLVYLVAHLVGIGAQLVWHTTACVYLPILLSPNDNIRWSR